MTRYDRWAMALKTFIECACGGLLVIGETDYLFGEAVYKCNKCKLVRRVVRNE